MRFFPSVTEGRPGPSVLAAVTLLIGLSLAPDAGATEARPAPGRVLVAFQRGAAVAVDKSAGRLVTGLPGLDAVLARYDATSLEPAFGGMSAAFDDPDVRADLDRHFVLKHASKAGNDAVVADLAALDVVAEACSDMILPQHGTAYAPGDLLAQQWHLRNTSLGGGDIRAVGGWSESLGDSNVVVAVCDSGIDWHHPDLGGPHPDKVNGALWTNWDEYYGTPGVDDDNNGKVDDIRGWDFVDVTVADVYPGEDAGPADNDPMDFGGHGTLVAGCIAPLTDNGIGIAAAAPGCRIMALRIGFTTPEGQGVSYGSLMAAAFVYAAANGADIVNLSYGSSYSSGLLNAVNTVLASGGIIFTSAGNDNTTDASYLCDFPDERVLAVAATTSTDTKSSFSNYGPWVDLSAPGTGIYTTAYNSSNGTSTYGVTQGTSFSSPIAAGAGALIWSAHPGWTAAEVVARLIDSCDDLDAVNPGFAGQLGAGRVNLLKALGDNVHHFPGEFPTLYDALNSAAADDTVKVTSATVISGALQMPARGIHVLGAWDETFTTRDPVGGKTQVNATASGTGLSFVGDADERTVVDGFRISGGGGVTLSNIPYSARYGGGVLLNGDSPVLRNLEITGCGVGSNSQLGCGGGIAMHNSNAVLENVHVHGNTGIYGAGVFAHNSAPILEGCVIEDNTSRQDNLSFQARGGGLHVVDSNVTLIDCTVTGHDGLQFGGGIYAAGLNATSTLAVAGGEVTGNLAREAGGGVYVSGGAATLRRTRLADNGPAAGATFMRGGGLYATGAAVTADSLRVEGNSAQIGGGAEIAGGPQADVLNSLFTGNFAQFYAGGLSYDGNAAGSVAGNTITGNIGAGGAAGLFVVNSAPAVTGNISAFNTGGAGANANGMALVSAPSLLTCNDVHGNQNADWSGVADPTGVDGNIDADPLFCDTAGGDFNLTEGSPCLPSGGPCGLIGALNGGCGGTPTLLLAFDAVWSEGHPLLTWSVPPLVAGQPSFRLTGAPAGRPGDAWEIPIERTGATYTARDLATGPQLDGAVTFRLYISRDGGGWSLLGETELSGVPANPALRNLRVWPNPFNPQTTIGFEIGAPQHVRIAVYDVAGRLVRVLADRVYPAGASSEAWLGDDASGARVPSGAYFVLVSGENRRLVSKVLLLQ